MDLTEFFAGDSRTMRERMIAGDPYLADDPELEAAMQRAAQLAEQYHREVVDGSDSARATLDELIGELAEEVTVRPPLYVDYGSNISIGARTFINYALTALDVAPIIIGEDCLIGPNVQLLTPTHPLDPAQRRAKLEAAKPITLGDNVWLGGGVIVCPGVAIGDNSIVGAGSVVTRDVPPNVVVAGNPANILR